MQSWKILEIYWWKQKLSWILVKNSTTRPYKEKVKDNVSLRKFYSDVDENELVWHRDREDRTIVVLEKTDWLIQVDNQLPLPLRKGASIFIPKGMYHRVIKGADDLVIKVTKHS